MTTKVNCHFCGQSIDAENHNTSQFVSGWERHRRAGGTNAIILRKTHERWGCYSCIEKLRRGIDPQQTRLVP